MSLDKATVERMELEPCPFCAVTPPNISSDMDYIFCTSCGAEGPYPSGDKRKAWNQRPPVITTDPKPQGEAREWTLLNDRNEGSYRVWVDKGESLPFEVPIRVREVLSSEAARVPVEPPVVIPVAPTCPVCLSIRLVVTCVDCEVDLSEHIGCLWDRKSLHDTQITQRKPPDPLHNKSAEWQAGYQWGLSGAAEVKESHERLLEAAKAVVMLWDIGSDDRLKDGIKLLSAAIEAQGKEEG